jgi:SagB-type dehydrogenase family enzyme
MPQARFLRLSPGRELNVSLELRDITTAPVPFANVAELCSGPTSGALRAELAHLASMGALQDCVLGAEGREVAVVNFPYTSRIRPGLHCPAGAIASPHLYARFDGDGWLLSCPETNVAIKISGGDILPRLTGVPEGHDPMADLLFDHGFLVAADGAAQFREWEFHDAVFHSASALGRGPLEFGYGATYPGLHWNIKLTPWWEDEFSTPALVQLSPEIRSQRIQSVRRRRSVRSYSSEPITFSLLSGLLRLSLRAENVDRSTGNEISLYRPFASGGARGELVTAIAVEAIEGLESGIYLYASSRDALLPVAAAQAVSVVLTSLMPVVGASARPAAAIVLLADHARMRWKYGAISYATILRNVGSAYQAISVAASQLGIGACPCGGGWGPFAPSSWIRRDWEIVGATTLGMPSSYREDL